MFKRLVVLTSVFLLISFSAVANEIGFTYSQAIDDVNWGVTGDVEVGVFEIDGTLQSGDLYRGTADISMTFDVGSVGFQLYSDNRVKGYELTALGRTNDIGAGIVLPIDESIDLSVSVFGRNGNPFAPATAETTLLDAGFTEDALEGLGLDAIPSSEKGITIKEGSSVNAAISTAFALNRFNVELKGIVEVAGEGEKVHQFLTDVSTGGTLTEQLSWQLSAEVVSQLYGDLIEYETAWLATIGYSF